MLEHDSTYHQESSKSLEEPDTIDQALDLLVVANLFYTLTMAIGLVGCHVVATVTPWRVMHNSIVVGKHGRHGRSEAACEHGAVALRRSVVEVTVSRLVVREVVEGIGKVSYARASRMISIGVAVVLWRHVGRGEGRHGGHRRNESNLADGRRGKAGGGAAIQGVRRELTRSERTKVRGAEVTDQWRRSRRSTWRHGKAVRVVWLEMSMWCTTCCTICCVTLDARTLLSSKETSRKDSLPPFQLFRS